jgi:hypothetical protein
MLSFLPFLTTGMGQLTSQGDPSLLRELWDYFVNTYFTVRFEEYDYQNFTVDTNGIFSFRAVVVALFLGLIVEAVIAMFQKRTLGDLVRALDRENANTPERAMTLEQLGLIRNSAIKQDLRHGTALKRVVRCVEEEEYIATMAEKRSAFEADENNKGKKWKEFPFQYDFYSHRFYIPDEMMFGATVHFNKKGTNPLVLTFAIIACLIFASLTCHLLPEMLQLADNFINLLKG